MERQSLFDVASKVYVATRIVPLWTQPRMSCAPTPSTWSSTSLPSTRRTAAPKRFRWRGTYERGGAEAGRGQRCLDPAVEHAALVLDEVDRNLALVCLLRTENLEKRDLIDYNLGCFRCRRGLAALNAVGG